MKKPRFVISLLVSVLLVLGLMTSLTAIPAQGAPPEDIEVSIELGLAWLVEQQDPDDGFWGTYRVGETGFAVVKLEDRAFELGKDPFQTDPAHPDYYEYSENVIDGLNYIFSQAGSYGAGTGICFDKGGQETYSTGIAMMAIAASRDPDKVVNVLGSVADGSTYMEVLEANVDYFVAAQNTDGGWCYGATPPLSDNSNTGYAVLGLRYAEDFGCAIPQTLKDNLSGYIDTIQCGTSGPDFGGSGYVWACSWVNILKTGNLLFEMAFVGDDMTTQRVTDAIDYLVRHWDDTYDPGWKEPAPTGEPQAYYQAMYCVMKGLEAFNLDTIDSIDWYADFADVLVAEQNTDGSWPASPLSTVHGWSDLVLSTEWALLTLQKVAPPPPAIIEVPVDIKPQSCPNPLNLKSKGVLPVAILGTEQFDVTQVDPASVLLEGVAPLRWAMEDVATPFEPFIGKEACDDCTTEGPDGYLDLTLKFDKQEIVAALGEVEDGECVVLHLTGNLKDESGGTAIVGEDVVRILNKSKGKGK